ncbi:MAG: hypothetical protein AAGA93_05565 [Actinomycetota bacterium]
MGNTRWACFAALALLGASCGAGSVDAPAGESQTAAPAAPTASSASSVAVSIGGETSTTAQPASVSTTARLLNGHELAGDIEAATRPTSSITVSTTTASSRSAPPPTAPPATPSTTIAASTASTAATSTSSAAADTTTPSTAGGSTTGPPAPADADRATDSDTASGANTDTASDAASGANTDTASDAAIGAGAGAVAAAGVGVEPAEVTAVPQAAVAPDVECVRVTEDFGGHKLVASSDRHQSVLVDVDLPCGDYLITLIGRDRDHRGGFQTEQTNEQWILEAYDGEGDLVYRSPPSDDIAPVRVSSRKVIGSVDLTGVASIRAVHAFPDAEHHQSVAPFVHFAPTLLTFPEPRRCTGPNRRAGIYAITRVRETGFRLDLSERRRLDLVSSFAGARSDQIVAYAVAAGSDSPTYLGVGDELQDDPDGKDYAFSTFVVPGHHRLVICAKDAQGRHGGDTIDVYVAPPEPDDPVLQPDVIVADGHIWGFINQVGPNHIVVGPGAVELPVGHVLVAEHTGVSAAGFSRRLVSVEQTPDGRRYETVDAELDDVFILERLYATAAPPP